MQIYRTAKGWLVFVIIFTPPLTALLVWGIIEVLQNNSSAWISGFVIIILLLMIVVMILGVVELFMMKIVIDTDKKTISSKGLFSFYRSAKNQLYFHEIIGFRESENFISIESHDKKIKISHYIEKQDEIFELLSKHSEEFASFVNLKTDTYLEEEKEILSNREYGKNEEEREVKLKRYRNFARAMNTIGWLTTLWLFFSPRPYVIAMSIGAVIPFLAFLLIRFSNGIIRSDDVDNSAHPSVGQALTVVSAAMGLRGIMDYNIFSYQNLWYNVSALAIIMLAMLLFQNKEFHLKKLKNIYVILIFFVFFLFHSYGTTLFVNCYFDNSASKQYKAKVLDKRISNGKIDTYYIKVSAWGGQTEPQEVSIEPNLYKELEQGSEVNIYLKRGRLKIPWFVVTKTTNRERQLKNYNEL